MVPLVGRPVIRKPLGRGHEFQEPPTLHDVRDGLPTADEADFFERLRVHIPALHDWYHEDTDGTQWMTVSYEVIIGPGIVATWRIDFDGRELVGGRSPAQLNWDDGVRGRHTGMSLVPPDGFVAEVVSLEQAVERCAAWLIEVTQGRARAR